MGLKENLQGLIEETGIKPKSAARLAGLGDTAIYDILKGRNQRPRQDTLAKIAHVYGVTVQDLLGEETPDQIIKDVTDMMMAMTEDQRIQARAIIEAMKKTTPI